MVVEVHHFFRFVRREVKHVKKLLLVNLHERGVLGELLDGDLHLLDRLQAVRFLIGLRPDLHFVAFLGIRRLEVKGLLEIVAPRAFLVQGRPIDSQAPRGAAPESEDACMEGRRAFERGGSSRTRYIQLHSGDFAFNRECA